MNKLQESRLVNLPKTNVQRSSFDYDFDTTTSFNVGELIPLCDPIEVLPGDTFKWSTSSLVRLTTLLSPIFGDLYLDTFFFFVPFRLVWEHYTNFLGENDTAPWATQTTYSIPQITAPIGGWQVGTLADYFGVRTGVDNLSISALPFRCYAKIIKDWFYDQNNQIPPDFVIDDVTIQGSNGSDYVVDLIKGGKPFNVAKMHDLFTSCLPSPQKGDSVILPLGSGAEIYAGGNAYDMKGALQFGSSGSVSNAWRNIDILPDGSSHAVRVSGANDVPVTTSDSLIDKTNLRVDLSSATATTINDLRLAFQTQRLLEQMARGGTRYYEILSSQWGITAPQGVIQRSEYLGGNRSNINVNSVVQTSATDDVSPQGNLTGYSVSSNKHFDFMKSFFEPGYIIALGCVRYRHVYSQGIPKTFMRKDRFDFYNRAFAHIGEQGINNYEIFAQGTDIDNEIFGYNEAWVQYRIHPNIITGQMRPDYAQSLDVWHLGDDFGSLPILGNEFIQEDKAPVDRVIAVSSSQSHQFIGNFYFNIGAIRPMPLFSIPGLIDHI